VLAQDEGLTLLLGKPEDDTTARWDDIVGVGLHQDGVLSVQTGDGASLPVRAQDWRGGRKVVAALRAQVPNRPFFQEPDEDDSQTGADT